MIQKHPATAACIALAASAGLALAEPLEGSQEKRKGPRPHMPPPLVAALDADKNREIDATEIANVGVALKALDKNNDGEITRVEMRPRPPGEGRSRDKDDCEGPHGEGKPKREVGENGKRQPKGPGKADRPKRPVSPLMEALDGNKDGKLDATELNNAPNALRSLDKNNDGKLTPNEFMGRPPRGDGSGKVPQGPKGPDDGPDAPEGPGV